MANRDDLPPAAKPPGYEYAEKVGRETQAKLREDAAGYRSYGPDYAYGRIADIKRDVRKAPSEIRYLRSELGRANKTARNIERGASSSGVPSLSGKRKTSGRSRSR